jgi:hypothetical protein
LPWIKGGVIHSARCRVYSLIEKKDKIVESKWDTLTKNVSCRIVIYDLPQLEVKKGGEYIVKKCAHLENMRLWVQREFELCSTTNHQTFRGKGNQKMV